jgi:hypothetical protein
MSNKVDKCKICKGEGWVCEDHADKAWGEGDGCCGGAGMLCICNKTPLGRHVGDSSISLLEFSYNDNPSK